MTPTPNPAKLPPMPTPIHPLLPPLSDAHRVPPLPKSGTWHPLGSADPLQVIARGLNTGPSLSDPASDIISVPDVWAQLTTFHNALETDRHPLHQRAVAEWRGLLAAFALGAYRTGELTAEVIPITGRPGGTRWADLVARLTPQCALLDGQRMTEVALIRVGRHLVGLAQPLTLVAPSRSLADTTGERPPVAWMAAGHFQDPLLTAGLSPEERAVLAHVLAKLCADLEAERDRSRDVGALLGHARDYLAQAREGAAAVSPSQFQTEPASLGLPALPVFRALRSRESVALPASAAPGASQAVQSDCLLRLRPGLAGTKLRGVLLLDMALHEKLGRPAGELRVWGRYSLRSLHDRPELAAQIRTEAQGEGILVVDAAELFLPRLYRTDGVEGEQGFDQHPQGARDHLLPLSPLVTALLDRAELARACRIAPAGAGGTTVHLRLPMLAGADITLAQHYPAEDGSEPPFALSVWPNFQAEWWRLHLGYSGASPGVQFVTAGFASLQGLQRCLTAGADGFSAVAAARALLAGDVALLADTTWFRQDRQAARALFVLPGAAEAAVLQDRRAGAPRVAGLLLLPSPPVAAPGTGGDTAKIGIDFGTTNTAVYLQVGSQPPEPMQMQPRHILAYRVAEQSRDELDAELLPVNVIDVPFQTILRDRKRAEPDGERRPFRDTLIYFAQRRRAALERVTGVDDLFANLKWGDDQPARERVQLFLTQVVIMALAEVAARGIEPERVAFSFSFPEAFRAQHLLSFQGAARNAVSDGFRLVAKPSARRPPAPSFQTESVATAQYFIHRLKTPATEGLVTFDIGGQTTDVAIVQSQSLEAERLAWRGSFQLAGRHLLIAHLSQSPAILEQLARGRPELAALVTALVPSGRATPEKRTLSTELLVNSPEFAAAFEAVLPTLGGMAEAERLRAVALTGLAGLFDYMGRTVRHLAETGRLQARATTAVSVCLGGRASLLYRTLLGAPEEAAMALAVFTAATGGAMPRARLVFSEAPKQEVAFGLVGDDRALQGGVPTEPLLGEAVRDGQAAEPATALLASLDTGRPWRIEDPAEFRRFIAQLPSLRIKLASQAVELGELSGLANAEMAQALRLAQQERLSGTTAADSSALEPPFIVLLRAFVHRLATDTRAVVT